MEAIQTRLLYEMKHGAYARCDRLPRESILASLLSISRTQLRDSLAELEREGFITRRHGVGTMINRHVLSVKVRMDLEVEFLDMISRSGFQAQEIPLAFEERTASGRVARRLNLAEGERVLFSSRIATANGRPTIYCEDTIPLSLVKRADYAEADLHAPIFCFLSEYCQAEPYLDLTELRPAVADGALSEILNVAVGTPLLFMDEVDYDIDGRPILYSTQHYVDGVIRHTVVRRKF